MPYPIADDIIYIGVNDNAIDLFEGQYRVPEGMAYNSYLILDEKIAVCDTVDISGADEWLENLRSALGGREPDYLIVHHMEPDHSACIRLFLEKYPKTAVVATAKAFVIMEQFFGKGIAENRVIAENGGTLGLGKHTLSFVHAPMVHWPEVMVSYDAHDRVLFSADAFGKFGAVGYDDDEDWDCEARRYYFGIVGKYGAQVQTLLGKLAGLDVSVICPLHGPVLTGELDHYIEQYKTWSSYGVESEGVMIAYTSVYGNTMRAAGLLGERLENRGCKKVVLCDLAREDMAEAVEDAFRYGKLVLATTTYNGDIFPFMRQFIEHLTERGYRNRSIGLIENGTWTATAARVMRGMFEKSRDITFIEPTVTIKSTMTPENEQQLDTRAAALCEG